MDYNPGRDSHVILRITEKTSLQQVALNSPTDERDQVKVNATAHGVSKRRVRVRKTRRALANVASPKKRLRERPNLARESGFLEIPNN